MVFLTLCTNGSAGYLMQLSVNEVQHSLEEEDNR